MKIDEEKLKENLETLYQAENKIAAIVKSSGLRFSTNKLTADLGEFYVFHILAKQANLFSSIELQKNSNAEFDLLGTLALNSIHCDHFEKSEIKIEVKTRRNQNGIKYLSSLKPEKFDLLCVVDLAINYTLNNIYLVKSKTAKDFLDNKYHRLIFKKGMEFLTFP